MTERAPTMQFAQFPFGAGMDQRTDPRLIEPPAVISAQNVRTYRPGSYGKRPGTASHRSSYVAPTWASYGVQDGRAALLSYGDRLLLADAGSYLWRDNPARNALEFQGWLPIGQPRVQTIWSEMGSTTASSFFTATNFPQLDCATGTATSGETCLAVTWMDSVNTRVHVLVMDRDTLTPIKTTFSGYAADPLLVVGTAQAPRLLWLGADLYLVYCTASTTTLTLMKLTTSTWTWSTVGALVTDVTCEASGTRAWYDVDDLTSTTFALAYLTTANALKVLRKTTGAATSSTVTSAEPAAALDGISVHATTGESIWVSYFVNASNQTRVTNIVESTWLERASFPRSGPTSGLGAENVKSGVTRVDSTTAAIVWNGAPSTPGTSNPRGPMLACCTCTTGATLSTWTGYAPFSMLIARPYYAGGRFIVPAVSGGQFQSYELPFGSTKAPQATARLLECLVSPPADGGTFSSQTSWGLIPNTTAIPAVATSFAMCCPGGTVAENLSAPCSTLIAGTKVMHVWPQTTSISDNSVREALCLITYDTAESAHLRGGVLGQTAFIGSNIADPAFAFEYGFTDRPEVLTAANAGVGSVADGVYNYRAVWCWATKSGQVVRSAPSNALSHTVSGGPRAVTVTIPYPSATTGYAPPLYDGARIWAEVYRTKVGVSGPYYLCGKTQMGSQPVGGASPSFSFSDTQADSVIALNPTIYTNDVDTQRSVMANAGAPTFAAMCVHKGRVFGIGPDRRTVWFSSAIIPYELPHMHLETTLSVDDDLVAILGMDDSVVAWSEGAIYALSGNGPSDAFPGADTDYQGFRSIASDVGCSDPQSPCLTPDGIVFRSGPGLSLLSRGGQVVPFGLEVADELAANTHDTVITLHPNQRWLYVACHAGGTTGVRLVYDYALKAWVSRDAVRGSQASSCMLGQVAHAGSIYFVDYADGVVYREDTSTYLDGGTWVTMTATLAPFKGSGAQGYQQVASFYLLGERHTAHGLTIDAAYDYGTTRLVSETVLDTVISAWTNSPVEQLKRALTIQKCQSVHITLSDSAPISGTGTGRGATWVSYGYEFVPSKQPFPLPAAQQR